MEGSCYTNRALVKLGMILNERAVNYNAVVSRIKVSEGTEWIA